MSQDQPPPIEPLPIEPPPIRNGPLQAGDPALPPWPPDQQALRLRNLREERLRGLQPYQRQSHHQVEARRELDAESEDLEHPVVEQVLERVGVVEEGVFPILRLITMNRER